jgi:uncharacterized membrane protein
VVPRRLSAGEWLALGAGLLLVVALFLPWYSVSGVDANAWEAFAVTDVILLLAALLAIAGPLATAGDRTFPMSIAVLALGSILGIVASVAALTRLLNPPGPGEVEREIGAWLGLAGAFLCAAGCWRGMKDEGPARRNPELERRAAAAARERAEHLQLPPDLVGGPTSGGGNPA